MDDPYRRSVFTPALFYRDPLAALDWLERAFGFERSMVITNSSGAVGHAEMRFGDGTIYIGGEWAEFTASPASIGGRNTQVVHVRVRTASTRIARARGAPGPSSSWSRRTSSTATAAIAPATSKATSWTFAEPVRAVSREEAEKASGFTIKGWA